LARVLHRDLPHEVIVVDSESSPETRAVVHHDCAGLFDRLVLAPFAENTGYTRGVNEGLRRAEGDVLLVLNPDIVVMPDTLPVMMRYLATHPDVGLLGPGLLNADDSRQNSCFRFCTPAMMLARRLAFPGSRRLANRLVLRDAALEGPTEVDWVMGSALMTTRKALDDIGLMDERFFHYLNEVDWAWRFWENGYRVAYLPSVQMYHYHKRQSKGRFAILDVLTRPQSRWHLVDAARYFKKHGISGNRPCGDSVRQPRLLTT
jgi:GT2 family glycosyltransferase